MAIYQNPKKQKKQKLLLPPDHNGEMIQFLGAGGLLLIITGVIFGIITG